MGIAHPTETYPKTCMEEINKISASMELLADEISNKMTSMGLSLNEVNKKLVSMGVSLDEIIKKVASLGMPGVILVIAVAMSQSTSYPIIFALISLGGPLGIVGGLGVLALANVLSDVLTGYGLEAILGAIYKERRKKETQESLLKEVEGLPITEALKLRLKHQIEVEIVFEDIGSPRKIEIVKE